MGMYTQLHLDLEIRPDKVGEVREYIANSRIGGGSYYFADSATAEVEVDSFAKSQTEDGQMMPMALLHVNCSLKNYDDDIERFFDFLAKGRVYPSPYPEFVGFTRYEENEDPILMYQHDGLFFSKQVAAPTPEAVA